MALTGLTNLQPLHIKTVGIGTFDNTVSIGGTLTYEDVTNIDSVGIVTARTGIKVLAGGINAVGVVTATAFHGDGSSLTGISAGLSLSNGVDNRVVTATGAAALNGEANLTFDGTNLDLPSNKRIRLGDGDNLILESDGTHGYIKNHVNGGIFIRANQNIHLSTNASDGGADSAITCVNNGGVELYYDNDKVFQTSTSQVQAKRRVQIHADGIGSGHGMSIGQWDGSNHRIEGDANRPVLITSYNSGGVQMGVSGANKVAVNSHGIVFNGDTNSSNALDDYEEGSFTPNIKGTSGAGTASYSTQSGKYTKIGNFVHVTFELNWSSGSAGGELRVTDLPFSPASDYEGIGSCMFHSVYLHGNEGLCVYVGPGINYTYFYQSRSNNSWHSVNYDGAGIVIGNVSYRTT